MSENLEKPVDKVRSVFEQPKVDIVLQYIVELTNKTEVGVGIILCVGGTMVCGTTVSGKTFFEGIGDKMLQPSHDQPKIRRSLSEYLRNFGQLYDSEADAAQSGDDSSEPAIHLPAFIHLRDAKFHSNSGKPLPVNDGLWWRGRLSEVEGFSLGSIFPAQ